MKTRVSRRRAGGVYVYFSTGTGFTPPTRWIANFGYGDGRADIVGFGRGGAYVSLRQ
jgi:hypothetical protein